MSDSAYLFTINEKQPSLTEGLPWRFSTPPQRERATGEVRRRGDDEPYTPAWGAGDDVFINYAGFERVVAWLILDSSPKWDDENERWEINSTVHVLDPDGPTLADIGVAKALQGGRQRLSADQRAAAVAALTDSAVYRFGQAVEAAARRSIGKSVGAGSSAS